MKNSHFLEIENLKGLIFAYFFKCHKFLISLPHFSLHLPKINFEISCFMKLLLLAIPISFLNTPVFARNRMSHQGASLSHL